MQRMSLCLRLSHHKHNVNVDVNVHAYPNVRCERGLEQTFLLEWAVHTEYTVGQRVSMSTPMFMETLLDVHLY